MRSFLMSNSSGFDTYLLPGPHDLFQLLLNDNRDILWYAMLGQPLPRLRHAPWHSPATPPFPHVVHPQSQQPMIVQQTCLWHR
jgi:hypothetical protein